jgi:hypothetical protein
LNDYQPQKYIDFTKREIAQYLEDVHEHVLQGKYSIAINDNRRENINFIEDYKIDTKKEKEILLSLTYKNFCYAIDNKKEEYSHETLYVFCIKRELDYWGELKEIDIFIKMNLTNTNNGSYLFIVSFHKSNRPIKYLFQD